MQNPIRVVRSRPRSESDVRLSAADWRTKAGDEARLYLEDTDAHNTVTIPMYGLELDDLRCMAASDAFHPSVSLTHTYLGTASGKESLDLATPFRDWLCSEKTHQLADRGAISFGFGHKSEITHRLSLDYRCANRGSWGHVALDVIDDGPLACHSTGERAAWFQVGLERLTIRDTTSLAVDDGKISIHASGPYNLHFRSFSSWRGQRRPGGMLIERFQTFGELWNLGTSYLHDQQETVISVELIADMSLQTYQVFRTELSAAYQGWEIDVFGAPSGDVIAWLRGTSSRPIGAIPIGKGRSGESSKRFSYSVSVVETRDGPCIELGSDRATHEQLQGLSKYFDGLEFYPI